MAEELHNAGHGIDIASESSSEGSGDEGGEESDSSIGSFITDDEAEGVTGDAADEEMDEGEEEQEGEQEMEEEEEQQDGRNLDEQEFTRLRNRLAVASEKAWVMLYLEFLLLCGVRGAEWRQAALHGDHPTELQATGRLSAQKVEGRLQDLQRETLATTWVSAAPRLTIHMRTLRELTIRKVRGAVHCCQRCALCYRRRHEECVLKRVTLQGRPHKESSYAFARTAGGITAPRAGDRAIGEARRNDPGSEQFGASVDDAGTSSESDDDSDLHRSHLACERYGSREARRQRRRERRGDRQHDHNNDSAAAADEAGVGDTAQENEQASEQAPVSAEDVSAASSEHSSRSSGNSSGSDEGDGQEPSQGDDSGESGGTESSGTTNSSKDSGYSGSSSSTSSDNGSGDEGDSSTVAVDSSSGGGESGSSSGAEEDESSSGSALSSGDEKPIAGHRAGQVLLAEYERQADTNPGWSQKACIDAAKDQLEERLYDTAYLGLVQAVNAFKSAPADHLAESAAGWELLQLTEAVEQALDPHGLAAYRG